MKPIEKYPNLMVSDNEVVSDGDDGCPVGQG